MKGLEVMRRHCKQRQKENLKKISKLAQEYNVPTWKMQLYYNYSVATDRFLHFREKRRKKNSNIATMDWKELYEILGEETTDISLEIILEIITYILSKIDASVPCELEKIFVGYGYIERFLPKIVTIIKRYLKTEFPNDSTINVKLFTKHDVEIVRVSGTNSGGFKGVTREYKYHHNLYLRVQYII